ncbi:multicopper oxidase family protein [Methyloferula stellata]|uniref:multicopper oxidase family protein n=1 Tax=Methyloferula stellata TaxID=876270 RepID=UPI0003600586|nr:multicopper oxidase family protein [Methyloferula stellata]
MFFSRRLFLGSLGASLISLPAHSEGAQPPEAAATASSKPAAGTDGFRLLEARKGALRLKPDPAAETGIWGYDGTVPGPLLRYKKGEEVKIRLANKLDQPTTIHWHGVRITNAMDGVANLTQEPVAPGASFDYRFTPPDSGFYWYHPDIQPLTGEELDRGLYGVLIVDEPEPPKVDADMLVVLDDWKLDDKGSIAADFQNFNEAAGAGRTGSLLTVNSAPAPIEQTFVPGSRLRLRILSAVTARLIILSFVGVRPQVIGMDGQPCEAFEPVRRTLPTGPGARFDVIFDLPDEASTESNLILRGDGMPDQTLLTFRTKGDRRADLGPLPVLMSNPLLPAEIHLEKSTKVELTIEGGMPPKEGAVSKPAIAVAPKKSVGGAKAAQPAPAPVSASDPTHLWTVNGVASDGHGQKPLFSVKRGTAVTLGFTNKTGFFQQIHVHGHVLRLLHDLDDGWEPYWRDAVLIPEGRTKHAAFVADNPGKWAIESSITDRAASGLATWFEVT